MIADLPRFRKAYAAGEEKTPWDIDPAVFSRREDRLFAVFLLIALVVLLLILALILVALLVVVLALVLHVATPPFTLC